jgi:hypothetical protein
MKIQTDWPIHCYASAKMIDALKKLAFTEQSGKCQLHFLVNPM